jgi:hypothetical protein
VFTMIVELQRRKAMTQLLLEKDITMWRTKANIGQEFSRPIGLNTKQELDLGMRIRR